MVGISGCIDSLLDPGASESVSIADKGNYYEVVLDFESGASHRDIGRAYGLKIKEMIPGFESMIDSYISEMTIVSPVYQFLLARVEMIKPQLDPDYCEELDGLASAFTGSIMDFMNDGRISKNEAYMLNLMGDVWRMSECSGIGVFGARSETGKNITARLFDFAGGSENQLGKIPSVTFIKNREKSVCLIGYLGFLSTISGFNSHKVWAAVNDCQTGSYTYNAQGKRSYMFDLRYALENYQTLDEAAGFLMKDENKYTVNHLIFFSDPNESAVLENNFSGSGSAMRRALRRWNSELNDGASWNVSNASAAVNSFVLRGNSDNHVDHPFNAMRWKSIEDQLLSKGDNVSFDELRDVATFFNGDAPDRQDEGDIYNIATQTIILFEPETLRLEIFFRPTSGDLPLIPTFDRIDVEF
jgi:hypothetical protein